MEQTQENQAVVERTCPEDEIWFNDPMHLPYGCFSNKYATLIKWYTETGDCIWWQNIEKAFDDVSKWEGMTDSGETIDKLMFDLCCDKVNQNEAIQQVLQSTHGKRLVYHDAQDAYWGDGADGLGENKLGEIYMQLRDIIFTS